MSKGCRERKQPFTRVQLEWDMRGNCEHPIKPCVNWMCEWISCKKKVLV